MLAGGSGAEPDPEERLGHRIVQLSSETLALLMRHIRLGVRKEPCVLSHDRQLVGNDLQEGHLRVGQGIPSGVVPGKRAHDPFAKHQRDRDNSVPGHPAQQFPRGFKCRIRGWLREESAYCLLAGTAALLVFVF